MSQRTHELKTWPQFFDAIVDGRKTFEVRENDRGFDVGDLLVLREYEPIDGVYTGRQHIVRVTYLTAWRQMPGHVVMSVAHPMDDWGATPKPH